MKINKFKALWVAVCCLVAALWSDIQCSEESNNLEKEENYISPIFSNSKLNMNKIDEQLARLKSEVSELQNQNKELIIALKGLTQPKPYIEFYNNEVHAWKYYENTNSGWRNMPFDNFRNSGEIRPGQSSSPYSYISIPESGVYSLTAWYIWQDISKGMNGPYTSIGVNGAYRVLSQTTLPTTGQELTKELGSLSYTGFLTGGDQVSLFISTHVEGTPYYPDHFKLRVERII